MADTNSVQNHLQGVSYPATKQQIISKARENDAGQDVIDKLNNI